MLNAKILISFESNLSLMAYASIYYHTHFVPEFPAFHSDLLSFGHEKRPIFFSRKTIGLY
jgi:hypothetical protein